MVVFLNLNLLTFISKDLVDVKPVTSTLPLHHIPFRYKNTILNKLIWYGCF